MLDLDYLERMSLELLEEQLEEDYIFFVYPWEEEYGYAA